MNTQWKKELSEINRLYKWAIVVVITMAILFFYADFFGSIKFIEDNKGLFSLAGIFLAFLYFAQSSHSERRRHLLNQIGLLKSLLIRLEYLAGEDVMKIFGKPRRISHTRWYIETLFQGKIPTHKILELDADFFASNLDYEIAGKSTYELKKSLYYARDKILMINFWSQKLLKILEIPDKKRKEELLKRYKIFVSEPLLDLQKLIPEIKSYIEKEFDVHLNESNIKKESKPVNAFKKGTSDYLIATATIISLIIAVLAILQVPEYPLIPWLVKPIPLSHECYIRGSEDAAMPVCRLEYLIKMPTFSLNKYETVNIPFNFIPHSFWESPYEQTTGSPVPCTRETSNSSFYCNLTKELTKDQHLVINYIPEQSETLEPGKLQIHRGIINKELIEDMKQTGIYSAVIQNAVNYPLKDFTISFDLPKASNKVVIIYDNGLPIWRTRGREIWWNVNIEKNAIKTYEIHIL
jgi:hypothetical protein